MASPIVLEYQCLLGLREKVAKLVLLANLAGLVLFSFSLLAVIFYTMYNYTEDGTCTTTEKSGL